MLYYRGSGVHMVVSTGGHHQKRARMLLPASRNANWRYASPFETEMKNSSLLCKMGVVKDVNQMTDLLIDLVRTDDVIFAATAITRGNFIESIQCCEQCSCAYYYMRSKTSTVRF